jgi:hypothetical protein
MAFCPNCSSDKVYPLLDTLRCKRCKNIWKEGDEDPGQPAVRVPPGRVPESKKRADPLERRLEKKLNECLTRHGGKFCIATMSLQAGDISRDLFGRYLERCVKNRALAKTKDHYGRIWYFRPG